jgi:NADH dehydrogenase FAD-containing subunit
MDNDLAEATADRYDIVVLGAGYAGMMAALRLSGPRLGLSVLLVNAENAFVERVRLQESMVTAVVPRIASLSQYLRRTPIKFICARVISLDPAKRAVSLETDGQCREIRFTQAIYTLGSRVDVENTPGAADYTYRLDAGDGPRGAAGLRHALRDLDGQRAHIVAVGGGALSVEAAAEAKSAWPQLDVTVISATRAGDFKDAKVESALRGGLERLGVNLIDNTKVLQIGSRTLVTSQGQRLSYDLCIWAAGMRSPPIARDAGLEVDEHGRVLVDPHLRSVSHPFILAAGDCAHPIAPTGAPYRLSALTAAVSGVYAGEEAAAPADRQLPPFSFSTFAQAVAVGRYAAVFPLDQNDKPILFVLRGRIATHIRRVLIWLVLHFITLERYFPGLQSWPGRHRVSQEEADAFLEQSPQRPERSQTPEAPKRIAAATPRRTRQRSA